MDDLYKHYIYLSIIYHVNRGDFYILLCDGTTRLYVNKETAVDFF